MKLKIPLILLSLATLDINTSITFAQQTTLQSDKPQSIELYRKQTSSEYLTFSEYRFKNAENNILIKADDEDYQNSFIQFNEKKYSLKQIYAPYHQNTNDPHSKYFSNDVSHIAQVFLLNNQELIIILSSSPRNFGMQFYPPFSLSLISIKDGVAHMKGTLKGLTLAAQGFIITSKGLELVQFTTENDSDDTEVNKPRRLSAIYQNDKLSSKIVPYTSAYEKQVKSNICKMYLTHTYHDSRNKNEGSPIFYWDNIPNLTMQEQRDLEIGSANTLSILEKKYCQ